MSLQSRTPLLIVLGLALLAVLAGAAFLAGKLINQQAGEPQGLQAVDMGDGSQMVSMSLEVIPAPELPETEPEMVGMFTQRDDNSIFVGTFSQDGSGGVMTASEGGGASGPAHDGPVVEVVTTNETEIYVETTELDPSKASQEVQQTVAAGNLDELGSDSMVVVWGRRTGDRIVADVIMYSEPMIMSAPTK